MKKLVAIGILGFFLCTGTIYACVFNHSNCNVEGCTQTGKHNHYNGCGVEGCTQVGNHYHNQVSNYENTSTINNQPTYYNCGVEGCNKTYQHTHNYNTGNYGCHNGGHHGHHTSEAAYFDSDLPLNVAQVHFILYLDAYFTSSSMAIPSPVAITPAVSVSGISSIRPTSSGNVRSGPAPAGRGNASYF